TDGCYGPWASFWVSGYGFVWRMSGWRRVRRRGGWGTWSAGLCGGSGPAVSVNLGDASRSEETGEPAPERLASGWFAIARQQRCYRLLAEAMHRLDGLPGGWDRLPDSDEQPLAEPDLLHAGQGHRQNRDSRLDSEVRKAFLERQQGALAGTEIAFREDGHHATRFEAPVDVAEERGVATVRPVDRDDAPGRAHECPEEAVFHHRRGVREVVDPRFGREQEQEADRVHPAEVVGDENESLVRDAFATLDVKTKEQMEEGQGNQSHHAKKRTRSPAHRQHVGAGNGTSRHLRGRLEAHRLPAAIQAHRVGRREAGAMQHAPAVITAEVGCHTTLS